MAYWYEKTVEYAFVRKYLNASAMPLDGIAEKAGDVIFHDEAEFFIVEFKRGLKLKDEIKKELTKYHDVNQSRQDLEKHNAHKAHYLVWGDISKNAFKLKCCPYISILDNIFMDMNILDNMLGDTFSDEPKCLQVIMKLYKEAYISKSNKIPISVKDLFQQDIISIIKNDDNTNKKIQKLLKGYDNLTFEKLFEELFEELPEELSEKLINIKLDDKLNDNLKEVFGKVSVNISRLVESYNIPRLIIMLLLNKVESRIKNDKSYKPKGIIINSMHCQISSDSSKDKGISDNNDESVLFDNEGALCDVLDELLVFVTKYFKEQLLLNKSNLAAKLENISWQLTSLHVFHYSMKLDELKSYLEILIAQKKTNGNFSEIDYGNILIVNTDGSACTLLDYLEFFDEPNISSLKIGNQSSELKETENNTKNS